MLTHCFRRDFRANYGVKAKISYVFWFQDNVVDQVGIVCKQTSVDALLLMRT